MPRKRHQPLFNAYYAKNNMSDAEIVRDLLGDNPRGKAAVGMNAEVRRLRKQKRDHQAKRMLLMAQCEELSVQFYDFVEFVVQWEAMAVGYHYHRGEWRKKRFAKQDRAKQDDRSAATAKPADMPKRTLVKRPPARRPMPIRRALDYRCPLVRGAVCRLRSFFRPGIPKRYHPAWAGRLPARGRLIDWPVPLTGAQQAGCNRAVELGRCQQPRPPPATAPTRDNGHGNQSTERRPPGAVCARHE